MKLLFISNNFPPISCGVGDYTYRLAKALVSKGASVSVLCSFHVEINELIEQYAEEQINVYSLVRTWDVKGLASLKSQFASEQFDVVSLQFVPFSFDIKGLPFRLSIGLRSLFKEVQWHIMFHELWVGMEKEATFRSKVHGMLQKAIIKNILNNLNPHLLTTNTSLYRCQIQRMGYDAKQLPLFSNIIKNDGIDNGNLEDKLIFAFFGNIHFGAPIDAFISELINYLRSIDKSVNEVKFLFLGRCSNSVNEWISVLKKNQIQYDITGKISESEISRFLLNANFGITTTPFVLVEKSGTVATMLQHNLKIICVSRPWEVKGFNNNTFLLNNSVQNYEEGNLSTLLINDVNPIYNDVEKISEIYLNFLNDKL